MILLMIFGGVLGFIVGANILIQSSINESPRLLSDGSDDADFKAAMKEIDAYLEENKC